MNSGNISITYDGVRTDEFKMYLRKGTIGILLTASLLCCFLAVQKIELPVKEEAGAANTYIPKDGADKSIVNRQVNPADILNEETVHNVKSLDISGDLKAEQDKVPTADILLTNSGFYKLPDIAGGSQEAVPGSTAIPAVPDKTEPAKPEITPVISLSYTGSVRMDYCVGSTENVLNDIRIFRKEGGITTEIPLADCQTRGIDTSSKGEKVLQITYGGETLEIPYAVVPYRVEFVADGGMLFETEAFLEDYLLDLEVLTTPRKLGKEFTGWYRDKKCTIPFAGAQPGETDLPLYAGFQEFCNVQCDDAGNIISYTGDSDSIAMGLLMVPVHEDCVGITSGAFDHIGSLVTDMFIPANITYISEDIFDALYHLIYIEVDADNPCYSSKFGVLYTKDGSEIIAVPKGRENWE